jgi:predicted nucleic-acid-binding Zn-ribbon protein
MKKNTQRNQSKKVSKKLTKKQTGGGAFSKSKPTTFKNLHYKDSSYVNPELKCPICNGNVFKKRTLTLGSKAKEFFDLVILDNRYKIFTCTKCGKCELYSNKVEADKEIPVSESSKKSKK